MKAARPASTALQLLLVLGMFGLCTATLYEGRARIDAVLSCERVEACVQERSEEDCLETLGSASLHFCAARASDLFSRLWLRQAVAMAKAARTDSRSCGWLLPLRV